MSSEMLGSARPEEDAKCTREYDGWFLVGDGNLPSFCSSM